MPLAGGRVSTFACKKMAHLSNVDLSLRWARQSERNGRDSKCKQPIKERTIPPQRLPQIFSRDIVSTVPLVFQLSTLRGKLLGNTFHDCSNQAIGLLHRGARLVDKADLCFVPPCTKVVELVVGKELSWPVVLKLLIRHDITCSFERKCTIALVKMHSLATMKRSHRSGNPGGARVSGASFLRFIRAPRCAD